MKSLAFLLMWTVMAGLFAWLGFDRLKAARETGRFELLWHGIGRDNWPFAFNALKAFLTVWVAIACLMTVIGCLWLIVSLLQRARATIPG